MKTNSYSELYVVINNRLFLSYQNPHFQNKGNCKNWKMCITNKWEW